MKIYCRDGQFKVAAYNPESDRVEVVASANTIEEACDLAGVPSGDELSDIPPDEGTEADLISLFS